MNPVKINKLQQIVQLRQMLRKWRRRACANKGAGGKKAVPAGHVAVYVGEERVRFVVRTEYLNHAIFEALLGRSQQEFGFEQTGALSIPCEAVFFEHLLLQLQHSSSCSSSPPSPPLHLQDLLDFYYSPSSLDPSHSHLLAPPLAQSASA